MNFRHAPKVAILEQKYGLQAGPFARLFNENRSILSGWEFNRIIRDQSIGKSGI